MCFLFRLLLAALRAMMRSRQDLVLENVALRHQLEVYRRSRRRLPLTVHDRRPLVDARPVVGRVAHGRALRARRHRGALAPHGLAQALGAEESETRARTPRLDRETQALIQRMPARTPAGVR